MPDLAIVAASAATYGKPNIIYEMLHRRCTKTC